MQQNEYIECDFEPKIVLTYGSLFSGIGGIDRGLDNVGMQCKWQVELDPYAIRVLEKHWPTVHRYKDIKEFPPAGLCRDGFYVDIICGGFPCQDLSVAGKQKGIQAGEKSGLWREFIRVVREIKPRYVMVENVPGLLSSQQGRNMGIVLGDLAQAGYDAEWRVLSAADVGAPHLRKRVFIIAWKKNVADPKGVANIKRERRDMDETSRGWESPYPSTEPSREDVADTDINNV